MIGMNSGGGVGASRVFLTSFDVTGSLDHSCMHNTNNIHPTNKRKRKKNKQEKRKNNPQAYLGYLDLDDY